jgi:hypothetical protein
MSKIVKLIISGLLITLSILSFCTYRSYERNKQSKSRQIINNQTKQEQTFRVIDKEAIINKLNLESNLITLSGDIEIEAKYSNQNISDEDVDFKWIKQKFAELNSKDITVDNTYKFSFSYSLMDLPIHITNNTIDIRISPNRLSLSQCELFKTNSIKDRIGLLDSKFTPTQLSSIESRTRDLAYNRILSDTSLRENAMNNLQSDIKNLIRPLLNKNTNIHFDTTDYDVVQDNTTNIVK